MDEATTDPLTPVQIEYRRLRSRVLRVVVLCALVPFGIEGFLSTVSAPPALLSIGMGVTMAGIVASVAYVWRAWRCPVCGITLWSAGGAGTLGGKCLGCQTQLSLPRRSKGGRPYQ
jgi:hypothetical protein